MSLYRKKVSGHLEQDTISDWILVPSGMVKSLSAIPRDSASVLIDYDINYSLNYPNLHWKNIRVNSSVQSYILKGLSTRRTDSLMIAF